MQEAKIPRVAVVCLAIAVTNGCRDNESSAPPSLRDINLTGMWAAEMKVDIYRRSTQEYLYSTYHRYSYVITDTEEGTRMSECWAHTDDDAFVVKTDDRLYSSVNETGFNFVRSSGTSLVRRPSDDWEPDEEFIYDAIETITRYQDSATPTEGRLNLTLPDTRVFTEKLCASEHWSNLSDKINRELVIKSGEDRATLYVSLNKGAAPGSYAHNADPASENPIPSFMIHGINGLEPLMSGSTTAGFTGSGTIVIETLDSARLVMQFDLQDGPTHLAGTLEFTPPWELKR